MYKPTKEQIAELKAQVKAKHGKGIEIFKLVVGDKMCIMRTPTRKELGYASKSAEKDPLAFNEVILKQCFVEGDTEIRDDDSYFLGASKQLSDLIEVRESSLEKL